ncbi:MAG: hypothetical protein ACRCZI_14925 [Cetobacterium sp.]
MAVYSEEKSAQVGYEAYSKSVGNKNYLGEDMPTWKELPTPQKVAWIEATAAICSHFNKFLIEAASV